LVKQVLLIQDIKHLSERNQGFISNEYGGKFASFDPLPQRVFADEKAFLVQPLMNLTNCPDLTRHNCTSSLV